MIARVGGNFFHDSTTNTTVSVTYTPKAIGNMLIVSWEDNPATGGSVGLADTALNGWTTVVPYTRNGSLLIDLAIFYCPSCNNNTATTITATATTSSTSRRIFVTEFTNQLQLTNVALDQIATTTGNSGTPNSGATPTTTFSNELVYGFLVGNTGEVKGSSFTLDQDDSGSGVMTEYKLVSSIGTYSADFTMTSGLWSAAVATFKCQPGLLGCTGSGC